MLESEDLELPNRRQAHRVRQTVSIRYLHQGGKVHEGSALDISQSGARLILDEQDVASPELTIEFEGKLAVLARPVWEERLAGRKRVVGVVFEGFHWGQKIALETYLLDLQSRAA